MRNTNRKMTMIYKTLHRNQRTEKHEQENDNDLQNTTQKSTDWETRTGKWQWSTKHYTEITRLRNTNRKMTMIYKTLHRNQQTEKHEQENDNDLQNTTQKSINWETRTGKWQWSTKHYKEINRLRNTNRKMTKIYKTLHRNQHNEKHEQKNVRVSQSIDFCVVFCRSLSFSCSCFSVWWFLCSVL
jgi:uncharacterized Zn finger protein (UPF0148 family)